MRPSGGTLTGIRGLPVGLSPLRCSGDTAPGCHRRGRRLSRGRGFDRTRRSSVHGCGARAGGERRRAGNADVS
ncbi:hypothetical protein FM119_10255 [Mycetocola reblochoni REB411]|uniref:Uncharacterized protein n=1 Tax=Mycetocola reblochoni REB411 TaxID=1255698 RepID=A0A1R4JYG1_9MICO|nr:hypothetical protein FM119_10255 [Mycetocola reblochoni REB411]